MTESKFTEKESIEIISQMLRQTRKNVSEGSGKAFLIYGYSTIAVGAATFLACHITGNPIWNFLWFAMLGIWIIFSIIGRKYKPDTITYLDQTIGNVWRIIGSLFGISVIIIAASAFFFGAHVMDFRLTMPLSAIYLSIGTSLTGFMIKDKTITLCPLAAFTIGIVMLISMLWGEGFTNEWNLYFAAVSVFTMLIPGIIIKRKYEKIC